MKNDVEKPAVWLSFYGRIRKILQEVDRTEIHVEDDLTADKGREVIVVQVAISDCFKIGQHVVVSGFLDSSKSICVQPLVPHDLDWLESWSNGTSEDAKTVDLPVIQPVAETRDGPEPKWENQEYLPLLLSENSENAAHIESDSDEDTQVPEAEAPDIADAILGLWNRETREAKTLAQEIVKEPIDMFRPAKADFGMLGWMSLYPSEADRRLMLLSGIGSVENAGQVQKTVSGIDVEVDHIVRDILRRNRGISVDQYKKRLEISDR